MRIVISVLLMQAYNKYCEAIQEYVQNCIETVQSSIKLMRLISTSEYRTCLQFQVARYCMSDLPSSLGITELETGFLWCPARALLSPFEILLAQVTNLYLLLNMPSQIHCYVTLVHDRSQFIQTHMGTAAEMVASLEFRNLSQFISLKTDYQPFIPNCEQLLPKIMMVNYSYNYCQCKWSSTQLFIRPNIKM